jgi:hypothetical protein
MIRLLLAICLIASPSIASAAWKVETGKKAMTTFPPLVGKIATVPAKAPYKDTTARLQLECFISPQLTGLQFGIVLSKRPPNGFMAWRYQYDGAPAVKKGPYSRALPPESISLGDAKSAEVKGLIGAKRLRLTLLPADGSELSYEFDVTGAADAIKAVRCKEMNKLQ